MTDVKNKLKSLTIFNMKSAYYIKDRCKKCLILEFLFSKRFFLSLSTSLSLTGTKAEFRELLKLTCHTKLRLVLGCLFPHLSLSLQPGHTSFMGTTREEKNGNSSPAHNITSLKGFPTYRYPSTSFFF